MNRKILALVLFAFLPCAARAGDDAPPPDKSAYTLFNPVPDDLLRDFSSDRPTKGSSPITVDTGHFQYEADIATGSSDHYNAAHSANDSLSIFDAVLKAGLTQNTDFELALAPFNLSHTRDDNGRNDAYGFGDVAARLKWNLFGNDSGDYALAVVPYVKAPTAEHDLGDGYWEGGIYAPFSAVLFDGWSLGATSELDMLENADLNGLHANYQNLVNLNHAVFSKDLTGSVEFWSDVDSDTHASNQYTVDLALAWLAGDNLQFDSGANIGVNKAAPDLQLYAGVSQRF